MEETAAQYGDGPISFSSIELINEFPELKVFSVNTIKHEQPFHVAVIKEENAWLVDWAGFADFYYDKFESFATGTEGPNRGIFRLFLRPAPGEPNPSSPNRFIVNAIHSSNAYQVTAATNSRLRKQLTLLAKRVEEEESGDLRKTFETHGLPFTLELSRSGEVNPTLKFERIDSYSWLPPISVN